MMLEHEGYDELLAAPALALQKRRKCSLKSITNHP
jgi:hypothetical protein